MYPPYGRVAVALLVALSRGSLLVMLALLLFTETHLANQLRLIKVFTAFCLLPGIAAWLLDRTFAATMWFEDGMLVLDQRTRRVEIPAGAVHEIVPWRIPLPGGGFWLRMRSGNRFSYGLRPADAPGFMEQMAKAGAPERVRAASADPLFIYTSLKDGIARRWYHPLLKFVVFALLPALPLFRLHQWIAYGGTFGEYYTYGLEAYLTAFAIYWATLVIYLLMYAGVLRALVEIVSLATAYLAPSNALRARALAELAARCVYFGGVPLLLLRYLFRQ